MNSEHMTFDLKVEQVIQEIVDSNFDLYKRITDPLHDSARLRVVGSGE